MHMRRLSSNRINVGVVYWFAYRAASKAIKTLSYNNFSLFRFPQAYRFVDFFYFLLQVIYALVYEVWQVNFDLKFTQPFLFLMIYEFYPKFWIVFDEFV